ncbi:exonuclease SbcCD subunit D [Thermodesulfobacteriota bacterium]
MKIFLTSDIHLGMKFAGYPSIQEKLVEARFSTLENCIELANKKKCELFVVAGDLFDRVSVAKRDIQKGATILSEFEGRLAVVLPGNHDFITTGQEDLWSFFKSYMGDNILVLELAKVYSLAHYDLDVNLYAAPCESKRSPENRIDWIQHVKKDNNIKHHIGIAHGSLEGLSPDFNKEYFPMTESELLSACLDIWLMGHTHIQYPVKPGPRSKIYYPSTPEPDGFDCEHEGKVLILEIDDTGKIQPVFVSTGKYLFKHEKIVIKGFKEIEDTVKKYSTGKYKNTLLKLRLKGRLPREEFEKLYNAREEIERQLTYLDFDSSEVTIEIRPDDIDKSFISHSFPHRLLNDFAEKGDYEALQIAFDLIQEARK